MLKNTECFTAHISANRGRDLSKLYFIFHIVFPLLLGSIIYLFFRAGATIGERVLHLDFPTVYKSDWLVIDTLFGSLPDMCWLYALLSSQALIWGYDKIPLPVLLLLYIIPITTELLQAIHVLAGTGDWFDVIAYVSAIVFYHKNHTNKNRRT